MVGDKNSSRANGVAQKRKANSVEGTPVASKKARREAPISTVKHARTPSNPRATAASSADDAAIALDKQQRTEAEKARNVLTSIEQGQSPPETQSHPPDNAVDDARATSKRRRKKKRHGASRGRGEAATAGVEQATAPGDLLSATSGAVNSDADVLSGQDPSVPEEEQRAELNANVEEAFARSATQLKWSEAAVDDERELYKQQRKDAKKARRAAGREQQVEADEVEREQQSKADNEARPAANARPTAEAHPAALGARLSPVQPATDALHTEEARRSASGTGTTQPQPDTNTKGKRSRGSAKKARRTDDSAPLTATKQSEAETRAHSDVEMYIGVDETSTPNTWSMSAPVGGRFITHDPIFDVHPATGENVLIAATQDELHVLSIETSLPIKAQAVGYGLIIKGLVPESVGRVYVIFTNGSIFLWTWAAEPGNLEQISAGEHTKAVASGVNGDMWYLQHSGKHDIIGDSQPQYRTERKLLALQVLAEGKFIVAHGASAVVLGMCKNVKKQKREYVWIELPVATTITCLDARATSSPHETAAGRLQWDLILAVGNTEGHVRVYTDLVPLFTAGKAEAALPNPRILHWHRTAVLAVKFSRDGNYIISGGKEAVLVLWQIETGKKQFLPHLMSEIERIVVSPRGDRYAILMGDNSIMVLSTSELKPVANFAGLQVAGPLSSKQGRERAPRVAGVLHPTKRDQLLLTVPPTQPKSTSEADQARPYLQTFDLRTARHVARQALTRNRATDFDNGPEENWLATPDVALMAISHDGLWLATADEWTPPALDVEYLAPSRAAVQEEREKRREVYLKIWRWDEEQGLWTLSTRVDAPHARSRSVKAEGAGQIAALVADPVHVGFATAGEDGAVRMWKPRTRMRHGVPVLDESGHEAIEWVCRRTIEIPDNNERADSPLADALPGSARSKQVRSIHLAYSQDASLLACAWTTRPTTQHHHIHLFDTTTGMLKTIQNIGSPDSLTTLHHIAFLDRHFVVIHGTRIEVWDLITETCTKCFDLPAPDEGERVLCATNAGTDEVFAVAVGRRVGVNDGKASRMAWMNEVGGAGGGGGRDVVALLAERGGWQSGKESGTGFVVVMDDGKVRRLGVGAGVEAGLAKVRWENERAMEVEAGMQEVGEAEKAQITEPGYDVGFVVDDVGDENLVTSVLGEHRAGGAATATATTATKVDKNAVVHGDVEDDRPVVRPEQLAAIFDVGESYALPPVKDMFDAVVGLYARKAGGDVAA